MLRFNIREFWLSVACIVCFVFGVVQTIRLSDIKQIHKDQTEQIRYDLTGRLESHASDIKYKNEQVRLYSEAHTELLRELNSCRNALELPSVMKKESE